MRNLVYLCICCISYASAQQKTAFIHINLVDVEKGILLKDRIVMIGEGRITGIRPFTKEESLSQYQVIDATGKFMIPGLIDTHVHLHYFYKSNQQSLLQAPLNVFLYYGVTGFREASGSVYPG